HHRVRDAVAEVRRGPRQDARVTHEQRAVITRLCLVGQLREQPGERCPRLVPRAGDGIDCTGKETERERTGDAASRAVRGVVRGTTARAGRLLAPLGVRFVVVPIIDGGLSTRSRPVAEPRGLVDAMSRQLDFKRRYSSPDLAVFENAAWVPVASLLTTSGAEASKSAGAESMIANDLTGATAVFPSFGSTRESSVRAEPGTLHLSVPYTTRWKVTVDGADVPARPAFGLTNAYDIATAGTVRVSFGSSLPGTLMAIVMLLAWLFVAWVALPRRRRVARRTTEASVSGDAISFGEGDQ
ncbi:MAG: hypothetical protein RL430_1719, partial [Actinomycetota bacterium]